MDNRSSLSIVFDTDCVMCSAWVRFILRHECGPVAHFVSAWSETGLEIASVHGLSIEDLDRTYLVILDGQALTKSDATFAIFATLKPPWRWVLMFKHAPRPARNWVYDVMAKYRYRWFGRKDCCFIPEKDQSARFVLGPPRSSVLPDHG